MNFINDETSQYLTKKNKYSHQLELEQQIYQNEIDRIKRKKTDIQKDLYDQLSFNVKDNEELESRISDINIRLKLLQELINNMEKSSYQDRKQIMKHNKLYISKNKNLKFLKQSLEYQLINLNQELNLIFQEHDNILTNISSDTNNKIELYKHEISEKSKIVDTWHNELAKLDMSNSDSKTLQVKYQNIVDNYDESHLQLTNLIQKFNEYVSQIHQKKQLVESEYSSHIDQKSHQISQLETKLNNILKAENHKNQKIYQQSFQNKQELNKKYKVRYELLKELEELSQRKLINHRLVTNYERDANVLIDKLQVDYDRAKKRLSTIQNRIKKNITSANQYKNKVIKQYQDELDEMEENIKNSYHHIDTLQSQNDKIKLDETNFQEDQHKLKVNNKNLERQIKDKEKQLIGLKSRVNRRLEVFNDRLNKLNTETLQNDLNYAIKMEELTKIQNSDDARKLTLIQELALVN